MNIRNSKNLQSRVNRVARLVGQKGPLTPEALRKMSDAELAAEIGRALAQIASDDPLRPQLETARKFLIEEGLHS